MTVSRRVAYAAILATLLGAGAPGLALAESETPVAGEYAAEDYRPSAGGRSGGDTNLYVTLSDDAARDGEGYDTSAQTRMLVSVPANDSSAAAATAAAVCSSAGLALGAFALAGRKG